jgi:indole-3-glycerol phosphate synthase
VLTDEATSAATSTISPRSASAVATPLLRKDFVVDAYQIDEARVAGADAVLLIVAALAPVELAALQLRAEELGLCALVEVHDEAELDTALESGARVIGINNRDLRTFHTDLAVSERLAPRVPEGVVVVAESGIFTGADMARLAACGAHAFLSENR